MGKLAHSITSLMTIVVGALLVIPGYYAYMALRDSIATGGSGTKLDANTTNAMGAMMVVSGVGVGLGVYSVGHLVKQLYVTIPVQTDTLGLMKQLIDCRNNLKKMSAKYRGSAISGIATVSIIVIAGIIVIYYSRKISALDKTSSTFDTDAIGNNLIVQCLSYGLVGIGGGVVIGTFLDIAESIAEHVSILERYMTQALAILTGCVMLMSGILTAMMYAWVSKTTALLAIAISYMIGGLIAIIIPIVIAATTGE